MKNFCENFDGLAVIDGDEDTEMLVARLRCGMWSCDYCANKNRMIWRAHIIDRVNKLGGDWLFLTITAHRNAHKANKTVVNLKNAWKRLYDRLRYKFKGQKLEYVWLYERHSTMDNKGRKKSTFHVHALLRAYIDGRNVWNEARGFWYHAPMHNWLKDNAAAVGAGFMCHASKIEDSNGGLVAAYITKYMTKAAQDLGKFPKRARRISVSRGFGSPKKQETGLHWEFRAHVLRGDVARHIKTTDVTTGERVTLAHFDDEELYPGIKST